MGANLIFLQLFLNNDRKCKPSHVEEKFSQKKLQLKQKYCNALSQKIMMNENFTAKKDVHFLSEIKKLNNKKKEKSFEQHHERLLSERERKL